MEPIVVDDGYTMRIMYYYLHLIIDFPMVAHFCSFWSMKMLWRPD